MSGNAQNARIAAYLGSSGSGKTTAMKARLAVPRRGRVIVWSPKEAIDNFAGDWPGAVVTSSAAEVLAQVRRGTFCVVFRPPVARKAAEKQFDAVCRIALAARNVSFVADELHTVTRPSWAPDGWSELVMMGRGYGCEIVGGSQRPASMDKDFLGNCSTVRTGRLSYPDDARIVARTLGVHESEVANLSGFEWIERDMQTGAVTRSTQPKSTKKAKKV